MQRKTNLIIILLFIMNCSCKARVSDKELNFSINKILTTKMEQNFFEHKKEGSYIAKNLTKKEFDENKKRVLNRFLLLRKSLLNSSSSYKSKGFVLIEQINMEVFDYLGYLVIDDKIYSSRNGKLSSYQNENSLKEKKPEIGNFITRVLNKEKPIFYSDGSNPNCYHGCLSNPIITIVENGKVKEFYEAKIGDNTD